MNEILLYTFLLSISPFGEARAGIVYAVLNDVQIGMAFAIGLLGNLLVFPIFMWLIDSFNHKLWPVRLYKRGVVSVCRFAKRSMGNKVERYGFWGLMIFVMVPLPGTGAYMGTIAASLFRVNRKKAFLAISIGTIISCLIMALGAYMGEKGLEMF